MARINDVIAQRCGLRHRSELCDERPLERQAPIDEAQDQALVRQIGEVGERYRAAVARSAEVLDAARGYIRDELGLRWEPWLAWTLYVKVLYRAEMHALGVERVFAFQYERPDPPAQDFTFTITRRPGETVSALQQRFIAEANAAFVTIQPVPDAPEQTPLGRQRKDLEAKARRNARWFYRRKVRQEPISRIAQDCHVSRVNVYDGIKEAERVLSLTPYFFGEPQEET